MQKKIGVIVGVSMIAMAVVVVQSRFGGNIGDLKGWTGNSSEEMPYDPICGNGYLDVDEPCDGELTSGCDYPQICSETCTCIDDPDSSYPSDSTSTN